MDISLSLPRLVDIIEDVQQHLEVLEFLRGRVKEARRRIKTVDDMVEEDFRVYDSLL